MKTIEVELDSRGRVPLGRIATAQRYRVEKLDDGDILLTPVVSISERELAVLANPELVARIKRGVGQMKAGQVRPYTPKSIANEEGDGRP
jgi:hypothetical protein